MRLQVIVDDSLGHELQAKAQELGFSVSSYVRYLLKNSLNKSNLAGVSINNLKNARAKKVVVTKLKNK